MLERTLLMISRWKKNYMILHKTNNWKVNRQSDITNKSEVKTERMP